MRKILRLWLPQQKALCGLNEGSTLYFRNSFSKEILAFSTFLSKCMIKNKKKLKNKTSLFRLYLSKFQVFSRNSNFILDVQDKKKSSLDFFLMYDLWCQDRKCYNDINKLPYLPGEMSSFVTVAKFISFMNWGGPVETDPWPVVVCSMNCLF